MVEVGLLAPDLFRAVMAKVQYLPALGLPRLRMQVGFFVLQV